MNDVRSITESREGLSSKWNPAMKNGRTLIFKSSRLLSHRQAGVCISGRHARGTIRKCPAFPSSKAPNGVDPLSDHTVVVKL
jgi:hypothetical protein